MADHRSGCHRPPGPESVPPLVFIVGSGRSGTTLLRAMCDAHRDLAITHEAHFVAAMGRHHRRYEGNGSFATGRFVADLYRDPKFRQVGVDRGSVERALRSSPPRSFAEAVHEVFAVHARSRGKSRAGDKTPGYVLRMPLLARLFPEARFVHLVRDGRDVAVAFSEVSFGPHDAGEAATYWKRRVGRGRRAGRALGPDRYLEVRYEELVADSEPVLRGVCDFVGLPFDAAMLRYHEGSSRSVADTGIPEAHQRLLLPPTGGLRNWREEMPADDVRLFEAVAGDLLDDLGYPRAHAGSSVTDRASARWQFLRWQGHRGWYNIRKLAPAGRLRGPGSPRPDAAGGDDGALGNVGLDRGAVADPRSGPDSELDVDGGTHSHQGGATEGHAPGEESTG